MIDKISFDIWFLYGSFAYGVEGKPVYASQKAIDVQVLTDSESDARETIDLLRTLSTRSQGLLKTEIRVYSEGEDKPAHLFTQHCPALIKTEPIMLRLIDVQGVTPVDMERLSSFF